LKFLWPANSYSQREKAFPNGGTHLHAKEKEIKFKPERTYLFMTVIKIDDPQYARTWKIGMLDR
jgi:hypothetical protein